MNYIATLLFPRVVSSLLSTFYFHSSLYITFFHFIPQIPLCKQSVPVKLTWSFLTAAVLLKSLHSVYLICTQCSKHKSKIPPRGSHSLPPFLSPSTIDSKRSALLHGRFTRNTSYFSKVFRVINVYFNNCHID